jgi:WhiB family redox-sensing transcriptional regulator
MSDKGSGHEGDTSAGGREAVGSVTGEGGDPTADWRDLALCREVDTEIFFPERGKSAKAAQLICSRCEVQPECLAYALAVGEEFGVWGGVTFQSRRQLNSTTKKRHAIAARRRAVGKLASLGRTPKEIADELHMTERMVFRDRVWLSRRAAA